MGGNTGEPQRLRLDDQLCFAMYGASNAITRAYRAGLTKLDLTYPQYLVLLVLWESEPQTVTAIAGRLDLATHAITPVINRLVERGLVERDRRDPDDRRRVDISLTDEGRALHDAAHAVQRCVAADTGLDIAGLAALRDQLKAVSRELGRSNP